MQRALYLKNYRNIGINKSEKLVLNDLVIKGKMGNLIIVVGANNCGKSNLLSGLIALRDNNITERDIPNNIDCKELNPKITLVSKDNNDDYSYRIDYNKNISIRYPSYNENDYINNKYEFINNIYYKKYNMNFIPQIIDYKESDISSFDLESKIDSIYDNLFLVNLFKNIKISIKEVIDNFNNESSFLIENKINKRLEKLSCEFNRLFFVDSTNYDFKIVLKDKVRFVIYNKENVLNLDYQSAGFKWFFNMYFNLLTNNNLNSGDIIIIDEPGYNLHALSQMKLRSFLKEFALRNDITIIIATNSPFLIDLDYLDELRIVSLENNCVKISNDFASVDASDPDSLHPIKNALMVNNHVLLDPDKTVVFVEGITDYNYLINFKKLLNIKDDLVFLPIRGVGDIRNKNVKQIQEDIINRLLKIKKHNAVLLVDGDGAGLSIKNVDNTLHNDLKVIALSDIDPKFKEIESLFDKEDLENLGLIRNGKIVKSSALSSIIKTFSYDYHFKEVTLNNFKKVLEFF